MTSPAAPLPHHPLAVAIETSSRTSSIALSRDGQLIASESFGHGLRNAASLLPLIQSLLASRLLPHRHVTHLYLSIGPGSFTGIRIAVTLAKSWALARQLADDPPLTLVPVPSADVTVQNLPPTCAHAAVLLDAKRNQVFTASYSRTTARNWQLTRPPRLDTLANLLATTPPNCFPLTLIGEGLPFHPLPTLRSSDITLAPPDLWTPLAATLAQIAPHYPPVDPLTLTPLYIRLPEAEEKYQLENPRPIATVPQ